MNYMFPKYLIFIIISNTLFILYSFHSHQPYLPHDVAFDCQVEEMRLGVERRKAYVEGMVSHFCRCLFLIMYLFF